MRHLSMPRSSFALVAGLVAALATAGAAADPPPGKGKGHGRASGDAATVEVSFTFSESDRVAVRDYYGGVFERGHCPTGLGQKNNGCMTQGKVEKLGVNRPP